MGRVEVRSRPYHKQTTPELLFLELLELDQDHALLTKVCQCSCFDPHLSPITAITLAQMNQTKDENEPESIISLTELKVQV